MPNLKFYFFLKFEATTILTQGGYANKGKAVSNIYQRNSDEFTDTMTALVELDTEGGKQQVRVFSLRGCHLLAMLSRTAIAKEFRKWVLDILDHQTEPQYGLKQLPEPPTITKAQAGELFTLVSNKAMSCSRPNAYFWSRFSNHFRINSYKELPTDKFDEAMLYLRKLEGSDMDSFMMLTPKELSDIIRENIERAKVGVLVDAEPVPRPAYSPRIKLLVTIENGETSESLVPFGCCVVDPKNSVNIKTFIDECVAWDMLPTITNAVFAKLNRQLDRAVKKTAALG